MIFRKSERRKWPTLLTLSMGALAVVGFMSIKNRSKEMISSAFYKIKNMFTKKNGSSCPMDIEQ
jgi:hypothetical protein